MDNLIYGEAYACYYKDEYLGIATYTDDPDIGDCFIKLEVYKSGRIREIAVMPDRWILFTEQEY
jgi:hypothetical protein